MWEYTRKYGCYSKGRDHARNYCGSVDSSSIRHRRTAVVVKIDDCYDGRDDAISVVIAVRLAVICASGRCPESSPLIPFIHATIVYRA